MKKYSTNFKSGFSLAELLISMTIAMVIAVALVPVVGMKKVKVPVNIMNHGIAECYYDESGQLQYYYDIADKDAFRIDTFNNRIPGDKSRTDYVDTERGVCKFRAPNSHFFEIITIGAGGDGSEELPVLTPGNSNLDLSGYIRIDNNFQNDIAKADNDLFGLSNKIREALDNWAKNSSDKVVAQYRISSPLGKSGASVCTPYVVGADPLEGWGSCSDLCPTNGAVNGQLSGCPGPAYPESGDYWYNATVAKNAITESNNCWVFLHGRGSSSKPGRRTPVNGSPISIPINSSSNINIIANFNQASVEVENTVNGTNNKIKYYVELRSSRDGLKPTLYGTFYNMSESLNDVQIPALCIQDNLDVCSSLPVDPGYVNNSPEHGRENLVNFGCEDNVSPEVRGSVEYNPEAFKWVYRRASANASFSTAGERGHVSRIVYEDMTGEFNMHPARSNKAGGNDGSVSYVSKRKTDGTEGLRLIKSSSGDDSHRENNVSFGINISELPFIPNIYELANPNNTGEGDYSAVLAKFNTSGYANPLANCADNICPGFGGWSPYVYIENLTSATGLSITNNQNNASYTEYGEGYSVPTAASCKNGGKLGEEQGDDLKYRVCKDGKRTGNPGAVIIVW